MNLPAHTTAALQHPPAPNSAAVRQSGANEVTASIPRERTHQIGGSRSDDFNLAIIRRTMDTLWIPATAGLDGVKSATNATIAALAAFKPTDEIEGMLAAQAIALHHASMECFRRAVLPEQPFEIAGKLRKDAANLARAMTDMLDALDRKRGKGPQVVRVERVVVHEGGQAIVGAVAAGVGRGEG